MQQEGRRRTCSTSVFRASRAAMSSSGSRPSARSTCGGRGMSDGVGELASGASCGQAGRAAAAAVPQPSHLLSPSPVRWPPSQAAARQPATHRHQLREQLRRAAQVVGVGGHRLRQE